MGQAILYCSMTGSDYVEWIFNRNITVGLVVICIVAARKIFLYRIPGRTWLLLWKFLILCFVCPITLKLPCKVDVLHTSAAHIVWMQEKIELAGSQILRSTAGQMMKIIWLMGAIVIAVVLIGSHLRNRSVYGMALPVQGAYFEAWKNNHLLKRPVEIKESDRIGMPLTYGLLKPVILLPAHRELLEKGLSFVLEHEFIHIKHMDVLLKWILLLVCSLYWYNPLIWVMYIMANRDMELACDDVLLRHRTLSDRKEYVQLLVHLEEKKAESGILCSFFCKYPIEERIRVMMKMKKENRKSIVTAMSIICFIAILSIGTMVRAETPHSHDERKRALKETEASGEIPHVIGYDEKNACEILRRQGLAHHFVTVQPSHS